MLDRTCRWVAVPSATLGVFALLTFASARVAAQPADTPAQAPNSPPRPEEAKLAEAKELFRSGVKMFEARDFERALHYFLRSRATYPSGKNTVNAAICLDRLGRYDEALELYEEVLTKFGADLDEASRTALAP